MVKRYNYNKMAETRFSRAISECERYLSQIQNYGKTPRRLAAGRKRRQSGVDIEEVPDVYVSEQPDLMENGELQTHQYDGLNWLLQLYRIGLNGILGDEMGVGKTIQTIALFAYLKQQTPRKLRHLVVGPKSVLNNWGHEFAYWAPSMKVMVMPGTKEERNEILKNLPKDLDVLITTFEGARLTSDKLRKINWEYLILDEAHKIKNTESLLRASLNDIPTKRRVLLTGTPIQNNLSELFSLLEFIAPHLFSKKQDFLEGIDLIEDQEGAADRLRKILGPLMLRRTKADLDLPIPPYKEVHIPIRLNEVELNWYKVIIKHEMMKYCMNDHKNMMMQLRKICLHPYMFQELEPEGLPDFGEHLIQASSKLSVLDLLVQKIHVEGEKLIIFSQFVLLLDILEDYCTLRGYGFVRLDGSSTLEERDHGMHAFQNDPETFIYLVSTRAGGLGINLTAASNVIFYDSDWNPQMDLQAIARAHRIGQKKNLMVYRLVQSKTIEENIINLQVHKLKLDHLVCNDKSSSLLKRKEAVQLISGNLEELLYEGTKLETRDIAQMIEDGKNKFIELQKRIEGQSLQEFIQKQEEAPDLELPAVLKDEVK